ncbi:MAG: hypothetical protein ABI837_06435, partial [Acidobacteriota bacterium]
MNLVQEMEGETLTVNLPDGIWSIKARGAALWSPEKLITLSGERQVILEFWPAGTLEGQVKERGSRHDLEELTVEFEGTAGDGSSIHGEDSCSMEKDSFVCTMPAGKFDSLLRAHGLIARYLGTLTI